MRYCPTCETKFEDDKIRFCTKDGSPLVEGSTPSFTDNLPSDSVPDADEPGEETVISQKRSAAPPVAELPEDFDEEEEEGPESSRIVIDTAEKEPVRSRQPGTAYVPPPPQRTGPGTGVIIFFSVLGTLIVVIGIFAIYLLLTMRSADANLNANENLNANVNENLDENFNADDLFNLDTNLDTNINANTNIATPTPSPSPSPTETPETNANTNANVNSNGSPTQTPAAPTPRPTVSATPSPTNAPSNTNRPVNIGTINSRAVSLPLPAYPSSARQVRATGRVAVMVTLDRDGNVVSATATTGHPLLRGPAEDAAMRSRFRPVSVNGVTVPARGTILYNFVD